MGDECCYLALHMISLDLFIVHMQSLTTGR